MTMSIKKYSRYCCVFGCLSSTFATPSLSLFTIPKEEERRLKWLQLINREDLVTKLTHNIYVCEIHFNSEDVRIKHSRKCLKMNSLPCLHLPTSSRKEKQTQIDVTTIETSSQTEEIIQNTTSNCFPCPHSPNSSNEDEGTPVDKPRQPETIQNTTLIDLTISDATCQTDMINASDNIFQTTASFSADISRKRKLEPEFVDCKKQMTEHESELTTQITSKPSRDMFLKLCDRFLSKDLAELVKAQTIVKSSHIEHRNSLTYKMFCLSLYYVSPQAYRIFGKAISLPCRSTLSKLNIPMTTEVNDKLMAVLKIKVNKMSEREKQCSLVIGSMSLNTKLFYDIKNDKIIGFREVDGVQSPSPANHALLVIIRGIFVKWSQPVGFSLLSEGSSDGNIHHWIDKIISKLYEIGLKIRVCISDLGSDMLKVSKKRGISANMTYFSVDGHKIYHIFDTPHLMKLIRNNFMTCDFHFQDTDVAKYEHIIKFYQYDKEKENKLAGKLTDSHINPTNCEKMKVSYATQLFSHSVASGLSIYIDFELIDESARSTVKFIKMMNDLFDILNSSNLHNNHIYQRAFSGTEQQMDFFSNMLTFFQTLELHDPKTGKDVTKNVKFIEGFLITIQSILQLHEDLKQEGYPFLLTRRLNQDITEIFFRKIRSLTGMDTEPTSRHFISAFRKIYSSHIIRAPKEGNGTADLAELLLKFSDYDSFKNDIEEIDNLPTVDNSDENTLCEIINPDYAQFFLPKNNVFLYVCGSLLKQCVARHNDCDKLESYMNAHQKVSLGVKKDSTGRKLNLVLPDDFVKYVEEMEQVFKNSFDKKHLNCKIGLSIYEEIMQDLEISLPCPCFPKSFLVKLFVRMRIYFTLKSNNKLFRTCQKRRTLFSVSVW